MCQDLFTEMVTIIWLAVEATLVNMGEYILSIHYELLI